MLAFVESVDFLTKRKRTKSENKKTEYTIHLSMYYE